MQPLCDETVKYRIIALERSKSEGLPCRAGEMAITVGVLGEV